MAERLRAERLSGREPPKFPFPVRHTPALEALEKTPLPSTKLTVIVAPTGYGKTVFQSALFKHYQAANANPMWLSLDERDQDIERLLASLERQFMDTGGFFTEGEAIHVSNQPIEERVDQLLDAVSKLSRPSVLFIDNISYVNDDTLGVLVNAVVERTPENFYLILAGTQELPVNLARIKMAGQLTQVGFSDLAFREAEVREVFGRELCDKLGKQGLADVMRQTEGWPAAVRLMQIILGNSADPLGKLDEFSGSDVDLAQMLNRSVLDGLGSGLRKFLLEIAPIRKFCIAQCRHATGAEHSAEYIEYLLQNNLFIIPLDRNRSWYRLHSLFREFLLTEGDTTLGQTRQQQVMLRAAEWCEERGLWSDAIEYAMSAEALESAAIILDHVCAEFVRDRGDLKKYIGWVETLLGANMSLGWETQYWHVWALVFHRRFESARQKLEPLAALLREEGGGDQDRKKRADLLRRLEIIRITIAAYTDQLQECKERGTVWLSDRGNDDPFNVATAACAVGVACSAQYEFTQAREYFSIAQASVPQAESDYGAAWVGTLAAIPLILEGEFSRAYEELRRTLERARRALGDRAGMTSTVSMVASSVAVEIGHEEEARQWLELGMRMAQSHGILDTTAFGMDAAIKLWGSPLGNSITLLELREIAASDPPRLSSMLECFLVQRLLRLGRIDDAISEAEKLGSKPLGCNLPAELIALPRLHTLLAQTQIDLDIATGRHKQAESRIAEEMRRAKDRGCFGQLVNLELCRMSISISSGDKESAARHITTAIRHAAKRRYVRPFRDQAERIASVVNETKPKSWGFALPEEKNFFADLCRTMPIVNNHLLEQLEELEVETVLLEQPTPRELELLSLIEAGLSNQQLADRLSVSVATVKWHLYNLYQKLGVSSRAAALAKARALNLLSR